MWMVRLVAKWCWCGAMLSGRASPSSRVRQDSARCSTSPRCWPTTATSGGWLWTASSSMRTPTWPPPPCELPLSLTGTHTCTQTHMHTHTHTHRHACTHTYTCAHRHTCTQACTQTRACSHMGRLAHPPPPSLFPHPFPSTQHTIIMHACIYMHPPICMHTHNYHACMHSCTRAHTHTHTHTHNHACMHITPNMHR